MVEDPLPKLSPQSALSLLAGYNRSEPGLTPPKYVLIRLCC